MNKFMTEAVKNDIGRKKRELTIIGEEDDNLVLDATMSKNSSERNTIKFQEK